MKKAVLLLLLFISSIVYANNDDNSAFTLSFGPMVIGEERIPISLTDFPLEIISEKNLPPLKVEVNWNPTSVQWIRLKNNLMLPRARMKILAHYPSGRVSLHYLDKVISMQEVIINEEKFAQTELYFSLFHPGDIEVYVDGKLNGKIILNAKPQKDDGENRHLIDYSCAPYQLDINNMNGEFVTASCQMIRIGNMGEEEPLLEVYWTCVNCKNQDGSRPPFTSVFRDSNPVMTTIRDSQNQIRIVRMDAKLPNRLKRFKIAGGLGPYSFESQKDYQNKSKNWAPSIMLYANYYINDELSFRAFEAAVSRGPMTDSFFNNFGIYFAYEIGKAFDRRIQAVALLGFQGLTFAHNGLNSSTFSQAIFPQGFEVTYLHSFGIKNSILGFGMFLLPSKENNYRNLWVRYGKKVFGELNYISWSLREMSTTMWGVSVGFPIGGLF